MSSNLSNALKQCCFSIWNNWHLNPVNWLQSISSLCPLQSFKIACAVVKLLPTVKLIKLMIRAIQKHALWMGRLFFFLIQSHSRAFKQFWRLKQWNNWLHFYFRRVSLKKKKSYLSINLVFQMNLRAVSKVIICAFLAQFRNTSLYSTS